MHAIREFIRRDARGKLRHTRILLVEIRIEQIHLVEARPLLLRAHVLAGSREIENRITLGAEYRPLVSRGQEAILRFYPNPATTVITFDFQKSYDKGYSLQIYHVLGRKMIEQNNVSDHTTLNLGDFPRGVYVYRLFDRTGKLVETGKFQVSK